MNRPLTLAALLLLFCSSAAAGATTSPRVESIRFEASVTAPVYVVPRALRKNVPLFQAGLRTLPEGLLVVGALVVGGGELGLSPKQAADLSSLTTDVYTKISTDAAFRKTPSALPYCFSTKKQTEGHYFLYRPEKIAREPVCIVFLHGYGGNFQFYMWVLKEEFPEAIILAPSWGVSWANGSATYLKEMLADAERRLGIDLGKPWLMAISAGGRGGFRIYNETPTAFSGYVCLAAVPGASVVRDLRPDLKILMLNGTTDAMVPIAIARKQAEAAKRKLPTLRSQEIAGNHFFLLSQREKTFGTIRAFMKEERPQRR